MSDPGHDQSMTYAEYAALPDDGKRYQLLDGELVVTPSPVRWHQVVVVKLSSALDDHVARQGSGSVYIAPLDVILHERTVLQPDVLYVSNERASILGDWIHGAPDLCVEVISPGSERIDRVRKLELYARFGVRYYWIVDLAVRSIEEYELHGDVYRPRTLSAYDDEFRPAIPDGFTFRLSTIPLPDPGPSGI